VRRTPAPATGVVRLATGRCQLTQSQCAMIGTVVAGFSNKDIAAQFSISERCVEDQLNGIFALLGVTDRLELALFAISNGLL